MMFAVVVPAFAWDFNDLPTGAVRNYWTGGSGIIHNAYLGTHPVTNLVIYAQHVEEGTYGTGDSITFFLASDPSPTHWLPLACFCTNAAEASFEKALRSGTPAGNLVGNTRQVSELSVERHGNSITVQLNTAQTIKWPVGGPDVTIPAFTMELDKVGGSTHADTTLVLSKTLGLSGYTVQDDNMGFSGDGALMCLAWSITPYQMTDCHIVMHGINTNVPP